MNQDYRDDHFQNLIIVAVKGKDVAPLTFQNPQFSNLLSHLYEKNINPGKKILTDDLAPVEYYNSFAQSQR